MAITATVQNLAYLLLILFAATHKKLGIVPHHGEEVWLAQFVPHNISLRDSAQRPRLSTPNINLAAEVPKSTKLINLFLAEEFLPSADRVEQQHLPLLLGVTEHLLQDGYERNHACALSQEYQ